MSGEMAGSLHQEFVPFEMLHLRQLLGKERLELGVAGNQIVDVVCRAVDNGFGVDILELGGFRNPVIDACDHEWLDLAEFDQRQQEGNGPALLGNDAGVELAVGLELALSIEGCQRPQIGGGDLAWPIAKTIVGFPAIERAGQRPILQSI